MQFYTLLTLAKERDDIDIIPFIEKREKKTEAKMLAPKKPEEFTPPTVAEGYWRCLG